MEELKLDAETVKILKIMAGLASKSPGESIESHRARFEKRKQKICEDLGY
jgi:hypothetical protein